MRVLIPGKDERGDPLLVEAIRAEIGAGSIPFARFMELCLQHPSRGYYRRGRARAGHGGDFLTSPEAHPAFAGVMARQIDVFREVLAKDAIAAVEAGAGTGTMVNLVATSLGARARVVAVDTAAHVHSEQGSPARVRAGSLPFAKGSVDVLYANELFDAFPVHRLRRVGDAWRELRVGASAEAFHWIEDEPDPRAVLLAEQAGKRGARIDEAQIIEVAPAIDAWLEEAARVIGRGFLLLADYGDDTPRLFTPDRPEGTLRCFAGHAIHHDPLRFAGTQDMTASVDFGHVVASAHRAGFSPAAFLSQSEWLDGWGVAESAAALGTLEMRVDDLENNARAIAFLRDARGLGNVKILALAKGLTPRDLEGLTSPARSPRRFTASTLPLIRLFDPFAELYE